MTDEKWSPERQVREVTAALLIPALEAYVEDK